MELRHLRYFVSVGDALSFTKAARELRVAQPSLSRQIRDLEEELGVTLLNRSRQGVTLTAVGKSFLADARRVIAHAKEIMESVRTLDREEKRGLRIGYVADLVHDLLPASIGTFQATFPAIPVHLFDLTCGEQLSRLEDGRLDLGFVGSPEVVERNGLKAHPVAAYKTLVAVPKQSYLARRSTIKLKELEPMFFVGISETGRPGYRKWLTENCAKAGFRPKVLQEVELDRPVLHAVATGIGVALLPEPAKRLPHANVVFRPISPPVITPFWVAWNDEKTFPEVQEFVKVVTGRGKNAR